MSGLTLKQLLPASLERFQDQVEHEIRKRGDGHTSSYAWGLIRGSASKALVDALDVEFFDVLAQGWCKGLKLYQYTDASKHPPDTDEVLSLGKRKFPLTVHPVLSLAVSGRELLNLRFTLVLTAQLDSAACTIRNGCITRIAVGSCLVSAQLKYGEVALHEPSQSPSLPLPGSYDFDAPGFAIAAYRPAPAPPGLAEG